MANTLWSHSNSLSLVASLRGELVSNRRVQRARMPGCSIQVSSQACWNRSMELKCLQVRGAARRLERGCGWSSPSYEACRVSIPSPAVSKAIVSRFGNGHRRYSHPEHGSTSDIDSAPIVDIDAVVSRPQEVEVIEDEEVEGQFNEEEFKSQFERLANAMAADDVEAAEKVLRELGNPFKAKDMKTMMDDATEVEDNLQQLYSEVNNIIEEGDFETAREIVEANYEALLDSLRDSVPAGVEQAAMLDVLAQLRLSLGDADETDKLLEQIEIILENLGGDTHTALLDNILTHMANMYKALGQPAKAITILESSLQIQENTLGEDSPLIVQLLLGLAATYLEDGQEDKGIETYKRVVAILERISGPDDEQLALPLAEMGHALLEAGRFDEAEIATIRSLRIIEEALGPKHWQVGCATCSVARVKTAKGDYDEAESLYRKGLQIVETATDYPEDEDETLMTKESIRSDFAELLDDMERYDEAQELWRKNLVDKEKKVGENDAELSPSLLGLASSFVEAEKYDLAEPLLRRSLKLMFNHFGPDALETSEPMERLASVLNHLDKDDEAEVLARQALSIRETIHGPFHPSTAEVCNTLASILNGLNQIEEAFALMQRVLRIQESELGHDSLEIGLTLELMIMLLDKLDRKDEIPPLLLRLDRLMATEGNNLGLL